MDKYHCVFLSTDPLYKLGHTYILCYASHFILKCQLAFDSYIKFENGTTHVHVENAPIEFDGVEDVDENEDTLYNNTYHYQFPGNFFSKDFILTVGFCTIESLIL